MTEERRLVSPDQVRREDERDYEWSDLSRAMDQADDVMAARGHRFASWSTEEYAAAVRAALPQPATEPALVSRCQAIWNGCRCGRAPHNDGRHVWLNTLDHDRAIDPAQYPQPATEPALDSPFRTVVDDLTGGCGCACHYGRGYRSSCEHCRPLAAQPSAEVERLRAERDALAEDEQAAHEEVERLRAAAQELVEFLTPLGFPSGHALLYDSPQVERLRAALAGSGLGDDHAA